MVFKSPFRADDKISLFELFNKINNGQYQKIIDEKYPIELRTLVDRMLRINPEERISIEEVLKLVTLVVKNMYSNL
jgi:serine/threonine protein kinase